MGTKIRIDGKWVDLEVNGLTSPTGLDGSWTSTNKQHNTYYTNGSSLIYVSAIFRIRTIGNESNTVTAGSSAWVYIADPGETGTNYLSNYTNISRVRDNGTDNADNLYLNVRFFIPPSRKHIVKLFNSSLSDWGNNSRISTLSWNEFELSLSTPTNIFNSTGPNSNNFQRSLKAPSSSASGLWPQFMQDFAVWHEPGNFGTINQAYSTTYTITITKPGDYTLEYAADNNGNITFDGTTVVSNISGFGNDPPSSTTISNVTSGTHTLVVTVTNDDNAPNTNTWDNNPAGIAWRLKPFAN